MHIARSSAFLVIDRFKSRRRSGDLRSLAANRMMDVIWNKRAAESSQFMDIDPRQRER